jgi:uncharacterized YkwD family protein
MMKRRLIKVIIPLMLLLYGFTIFAPVAGAAVLQNGNNQPADIVAKPGDNGTIVKEINTMLKALGFYYGTPNTVYSIFTKYAVKGFQNSNKITVTGIVDHGTYDLLKAKYDAMAGTPATPANTQQNSPAQSKSEPAPASTPVPTTTSTAKPQANQQPTTQQTNATQQQAQPVSNQTAGLTADEQAMLTLVNQEREKAGVAPLTVDMNLVQSARVKSKDMIDNNYFDHTSPTLGTFSALIRKYAPNYGYMGENLAGNQTVQAAHTALMNSEGHRKNILNPKYTHIGIGIVNGGPYGKMFTQHFGG